MLPDFVADHPVLAAFTGVLLLLLMLFAVVVGLRRRRRAAARRPLPTLRAPSPDRPAPLPALSIDSFALRPPRSATPKPVPVPEPEPPPRRAEPSAPASLLVVDDSAVARIKLRKLFEAAGYLVEIAAEGEEALALIGSKRYAVLVTDLDMPKMNGFQLIAAVQANPATEDMPIVAITGHDELSARVHDMKGLYGIFRKPWNDSELLQRVANLARLRRPVAAG